MCSQPDRVSGKVKTFINMQTSVCIKTAPISVTLLDLIFPLLGFFYIGCVECSACGTEAQRTCCCSIVCQKAFSQTEIWGEGMLNFC